MGTIKNRICLTAEAQRKNHDFPFVVSRIFVRRPKGVGKKQGGMAAVWRSFNGLHSVIVVIFAIDIYD
ncbi:MAG: hypothetical protein WC091_24865 [Sulfuricellaceae bacterium]